MGAFQFFRQHRWSLALGVLCAPMLLRLLATRQRNTERSRAIIRAASEAIITTDASHTIVAANPSAARMFATSVADMQGSALSRFILQQAGSPALPASSFAHGDGRAGRRASDHAVTGIKAGGANFPLEGSMSSMLEHGATIHTIILRDVTERHLVQEKLSRSHEQLRQLSTMLQTIREEERTHIARELHDDLGQLLASLRMDLALLQQQPTEESNTRRLMAGMDEHLLAAITSLRRIATNLRPRALDEGGLYFALQGLRREFIERHRIACELFADEPELRLDDLTSTAIFRIVQEALTNIARHAQAANVTINLYQVDGHVLLTIRDDGRGITTSDMEKVQSLGLVGMRERVAALFGDITISSDEAPGTRIDIVLPRHKHIGPAVNGAQAR
jgi:PAS domain S-box-containing protein